MNDGAFQTVSIVDQLWPTMAVMGLALIIGIAVFGGIRGNLFELLGSFVKISLAAAIFALIAFVVMASIQEQENWKAFAAEHCQIVEKRDGQSTTGVGLGLNGSVGVFSGSTDSQTAYRCDDGVTYWKNH